MNLTLSGFRLRIKSFVPAIICILLFCLSIIQPVSVVCIILLTIAWIANPEFVNSFKNVYRNKSLFFLILFYLLHIIGTVYSSNLKYARFDLQTKLSFLLFPLIISAFSFTDTEFNLFKKSFIAGTSLAALICFARAIKWYNANLNTDIFFYEQYSRLMHPAYFSIYISLSILFLIDYFLKPQSKYIFGILTFILIVFLFANISLLSSRTALITCYFTVILLSGIQLYAKSIAKKSLLKIPGVVVLSLIVQFYVISQFNRFSQLPKVVSEKNNVETTVVDTIKGIPQKEINSAVTHYIIWKNAVSLIREHPLFGVGTGDVHDELNNTYIRNNFQAGIDHNYNPHNQFLHSMVAFGLLGLTALILLFTIPLYIAFQSKDWVFLVFLIIILLNCLTESILERQAGIIFFAFFFSLFAVQRAETEHTNC